MDPGVGGEQVQGWIQGGQWSRSGVDPGVFMNDSDEGWRRDPGVGLAEAI